MQECARRWAVLTSYLNWWFLLKITQKALKSCLWYFYLIYYEGWLTNCILREGWLKILPQNFLYLEAQWCKCISLGCYGLGHHAALFVTLSAFAASMVTTAFWFWLCFQSGRVTLTSLYIKNKVSRNHKTGYPLVSAYRRIRTPAISLGCQCTNVSVYLLPVPSF